MTKIILFLILPLISCKNNSRLPKNQKNMQTTQAEVESQKTSPMNDEKISDSDDEIKADDFTPQCEMEISQELSTTRADLSFLNTDLKTYQAEYTEVQKILEENGFKSFSDYLKQSPTQTRNRLNKIDEAKEKVQKRHQSLKQKFSRNRVQCLSLSEIFQENPKSANCYVSKEQASTIFLENCNLYKQVNKFNEISLRLRKILSESTPSLLPNSMRDLFDPVFEDLNLQFDNEKVQDTLPSEFEPIHDSPTCLKYQNAIIEIKDISLQAEISVNEISDTQNNKLNLKEEERKTTFENQRIFLSSLNRSLDKTCQYLGNLENEASILPKDCFTQKDQTSYYDSLLKSCNMDNQLQKQIKHRLNTPLKKFIQRKKSKKSESKKKHHITLADKDYMTKTETTRAYHVISANRKKLNDMTNPLNKLITYKNFEALEGIKAYEKLLNETKETCDQINPKFRFKKEDTYSHQSYCDLKVYRKILDENFLSMKSYNNFNPNKNEYKEIIDYLKLYYGQHRSNLEYYVGVLEDLEKIADETSEENYKSFNLNYRSKLDNAQKICESNHLSHEVFKLSNNVGKTHYSKLCSYIDGDEQRELKNLFTCIEYELKH